LSIRNVIKLESVSMNSSKTDAMVPNSPHQTKIAKIFQNISLKKLRFTSKICLSELFFGR